MTFKLDLRTKQKGIWTLLVRAFPFVCDACGKDFLNARELVTHVREAREQEEQEKAS